MTLTGVGLFPTIESMKSSPVKKASITLPTELEAGLKQLAKKEHRTFSGILQEAARYYLGVRKLEAIQSKLAGKARKLHLTSEDDIDRLVHELREK